MRYFVILLISALIPVAVFGSGRYWSPVDYTYTDNIKSRLIDLAYTNNTKKDVCFSDSNWPIDGDILEGVSNDVWVEIDRKKFFIRLIQDYCPSCRVKVKPKETIRASIRYQSFGIDAPSEAKSKVLH